MALWRIADLPEGALAAAGEFHHRVLPGLRAEIEARRTPLTLLFAPADPTHEAWRLAAVQGLAREYAPVRVNARVGVAEADIAAAHAFLDGAEAITGQILYLDRCSVV